MEYKRLKEKLETILTLPELLPFEEDLTAVDCKQMYDILCKIEQGKLIELPCKVGDICYLVYEKSENRFRDLYEIKKVKIDNIHYFGHNEFFAEIGSFFHYTVKFGKEIFTTREEAEKYLKELQE